MSLCPKCGGLAKVVDSRMSGANRYRRRLCQTCDYKFTTYEVTSVENLTDPVDKTALKLALDSIIADLCQINRRFVP